MAGLESIYGRLIGLGISGEMWVDGSFLTKKEEPEDVDIVVFTPSEFFDKGTEQQVEFLNWLSDDRDKVRALFSCHSAAIAQYSEISFMHPLYVATRTDYADKFGHSVATRQPKGIVVIALVIPANVQSPMKVEGAA
jgi:hypothetical protein